MAFINPSEKEINCKIVYYGPSRSGKTTTLRHIYDEVSKDSKGKSISIGHAGDSTLFFDFVPLNLGKIRDYTVRIHLYTVPGQIGYQQSRALISKGVDGMVFIADSQLEMMDDNIKCLADLKQILSKEGHAWGELPAVFQFNKRDLKTAIPPAELNRFLNPENAPFFETIATKGSGIMEAFRSITTSVIAQVSSEAV